MMEHPLPTRRIQFCHLISPGNLNVDTCMARLAQIMNDNEAALIAARAERFV